VGITHQSEGNIREYRDNFKVTKVSNDCITPGFVEENGVFREPGRCARKT
jgi:hypothetical protein